MLVFCAHGIWLHIKENACMVQLRLGHLRICSHSFRIGKTTAGVSLGI